MPMATPLIQSKCRPLKSNELSSRTGHVRHRIVEPATEGGCFFLIKKEQSEMPGHKGWMHMRKPHLDEDKVSVARQEGKSLKGSESIVSVLQISGQISDKRLKDTHPESQKLIFL